MGRNAGFDECGGIIVTSITFCFKSTTVVSFLFIRCRTQNTRAQVESRGLFGKRTTYDNPWAPGITEKSLGDLAKMLRSGDMGHVPTEQETLEDLPQAEVRCACHI